eukprot:TRINITY_DN19477_c0_g1_i1.p1 TRINITY_DN19477_c0_g1~~TRINITY_DN19477_c0_g1_i1.p1  ORF type:complete len:296 (-),score=51.75 TRINITY_DN19477_c0_g1_i1:249-1136(-)
MVSDAESSSWLAAALGVVSIVCYFLMLLPQILLNLRRVSTEGLAAGLIVLWSVSCTAVGAYYAAQPGISPWVVASQLALALSCAFVEGQIIAYRRTYSKALHRISVLAVAFLAASLATGVWFAIVYIISRFCPPAFGMIIGVVLPSVAAAVSFFPQLQLFFSLWSIEGYSFTVSAVDSLACGSSALVIFIEPEVDLWSAFVDALPLLTIIAGHILLALLAVVIVCRGGGHKPGAQTCADVDGEIEDIEPHKAEAIGHNQEEGKASIGSHQSDGQIQEEEKTTYDNDSGEAFRCSL